MSIEERFLKYISLIQSDPQSSSTTPSSMKQLELEKPCWRNEKIGIEDAHLDQAVLFMEQFQQQWSWQSLIGFVAHMDTSPDASGQMSNHNH